MRASPASRGRWPLAAAIVSIMLLFALPVGLVTAAFSTSTSNNSDSFGASSSFYRDVVMQDAPSGWWRLGESIGTTMIDSSAAGTHPGVYDPTPVLGQPGASNDGNTAAEQRNDPWAWVPRLISDNLTIEFWFKTTSTAGVTGDQPWYAVNPMTFAEVGGDTADMGVGITGDGRVTAGTGSPDTTVQTPVGTAYNNGAWHHVAFTRTRSTGALTLYVDGASKATGTGGTASLTAATSFGVGVNEPLAQSDGQHSGTFVGSIDELAMYSTALDAGTVGNHRSSGAAGDAGYSDLVRSTPGVVAYWRMDGQGGDLTSVVGGAAATGRAGHSVVRETTGRISGNGSFAMWQVGASTTGGGTVPRLVADDFTVECWFMTGSGLGTAQWWTGLPVINADASGDANDFGLAMNGDGALIYGETSATALLTSRSGLNDRRWHHVAITRVRASGAVTMYVDGVPSGTAAGPTTSLNASSSFYIGRGSGGASRFSGVIDEVAQYPAVLSASRIALHAQRGAAS